MKSTNLFVLILIIISNLKVECLNQHIQRILARKNMKPPSKTFDMYCGDNRYILQRMEFKIHDTMFLEAVEDFKDKIQTLAHRTNVLNLTHTEYNQMVNVSVNERDREEVWKLRDYYVNLFKTRAVLNKNVIFAKHPLIRFPSVTHMLRKWMFYFVKDAHRTKNRNEFYAKMQVNAIKDSVGYMMLFYYYFDAKRFHPKMSFNMAIFRTYLYKRIEQEMPYLKYNEYF